MKKKEKKVFTYGLRDVPALCVAAVFVSWFELGKLAKRVLGIEEPPRPEPEIRGRNGHVDQALG